MVNSAAMTSNSIEKFRSNMNACDEKRLTMNTELARFDARQSAIMTRNADVDREQVTEVALSRLRKKRAAG